VVATHSNYLHKREKEKGKKKKKEKEYRKIAK